MALSRWFARLVSEVKNAFSCFTYRSLPFERSSFALFASLSRWSLLTRLLNGRFRASLMCDMDGLPCSDSDHSFRKDQRVGGGASGGDGGKYSAPAIDHSAEPLQDAAEFGTSRPAAG